jgi:hypothetical protein
MDLCLKPPSATSSIPDLFEYCSSLLKNDLQLLSLPRRQDLAHGDRDKCMKLEGRFLSCLSKRKRPSRYLCELLIDRLSTNQKLFLFEAWMLRMRALGWVGSFRKGNVLILDIAGLQVKGGVDRGESVMHFKNPLSILCRGGC